MNTKNVKSLFLEKPWIISVVTGLVLRLYKLTYSSIWHDEGYTMWLLRYNFKEIIERTARDVHPPGYYLIAKPWVMVFGDSVFAIRLLSLVFSVGIIYLVYKIIKEIWSKEAAFWGSLFVALSPFMIRFGQEARMYGVVAFFTTLATYYFVKYIKEQRSLYLLGYVPAMIIAMYNQYYAFFVLVSHWVIISIFTPGFWSFKWKQSWNKPGILDPKWWLASVSLLFLYLPWFPVAYRQVTRVSGSYWIKPEWITERTVPNSVLQFITYGHLDGLHQINVLGSLVYWIIVVILTFSAIYLFKTKKKVAGGLLIFGYLPMLLVFRGPF